MIIYFYEWREHKEKEGGNVSVSAVLFQSQSLKVIAHSSSPVYYLPLFLSAICCRIKPGITWCSRLVSLGNFPSDWLYRKLSSHS